MNVSWAWDAWEDYTKHWGHASRKKTKARIETMIATIKRDPSTKAFMAEKLKHDLSGFTSMRIDDENRLVYEVTGKTISIVSCRYHYS